MYIPGQSYEMATVHYRDLLREAGRRRLIMQARRMRYPDTRSGIGIIAAGERFLHRHDNEHARAA